MQNPPQKNKVSYLLNDLKLTHQKGAIIKCHTSWGELSAYVSLPRITHYFQTSAASGNSLSSARASRLLCFCYIITEGAGKL